MASEESDSEKTGRRPFDLHYDSILDSDEKSHVPTGLEMFAAYRQGILDPNIVSTQAATSKVGEGKGTEPNAVRVPPAWLKPRGVLGRLASGHVSTAASVPSSSSASTTSITAAQKIAYEPPSAPTKPGAPVDSKNLLVSQRQRGNPLLELIRHVTWEYAAIEPDYIFGPSQCAFFLSLRYHNLNPEYIFKRLQKLKSTFQLIVLIVLVDVDDAHHPLKELNKFGLTQNVTVLLAWSFLEAARYVECFKALVNKPPEELQPEAAIATARKDQLTLATDFFTSLRVVSRSDAAALLSRFGTVSDIIKADRKTLESCPGIGTVKAGRLYEVLHSGLKRKDPN